MSNLCTVIDVDSPMGADKGDKNFYHEAISGVKRAILSSRGWAAGAARSEWTYVNYEAGEGRAHDGDGEHDDHGGETGTG